MWPQPRKERITYQRHLKKKLKRLQQKEHKQANLRQRDQVIQILHINPRIRMQDHKQQIQS